MIGPSLKTRGGMTTVSSQIIEGSPVDIEIEFMGSMHDYSYLGRVYLWFLLMARTPFRWFYKRPSLVHIHFAEKLSIWRKASIGLIWKIGGVPLVLHSHGATLKENYERMGPIRRSLFRGFLSMAQEVIVLSEAWRKFFQSKIGLYHERIFVLENPIPNISDSMEGDIGSNDIIYMGRIGDRKGTFELINAYSKIDPDERSSLYILGDGDVKGARKLVDDLQLEGDCHVVGWVSNQEKFDIIRRCSAVILPSKNEGLPMALLEGMAHGLIPISTRVGGIPDLISHGNNGLLIDGHSQNNVEASLRLFYSLDHDKKKNISKKAKSSVSDYGLDAYIEKLVDLYRRSIGS